MRTVGVLLLSAASDELFAGFTDGRGTALPEATLPDRCVHLNQTLTF